MAGAPVIVSSPQGRFEAGAADGQRPGADQGHGMGQAPVPPLRGRPRRPRAPRAVRKIHRDSPFRCRCPSGQVRMRMLGAEYGTDLRGPTVCEVIEEPEIADVVAKLGPDPLRPDADPGLAWRRITKSRRTIGALLMDQGVIAGVGNVYRSELLYRHRIDPFRPGTAHQRRRVRRDVDRPRRADEGRCASRQDHHRCVPRTTTAHRRTGRGVRAPTSTGEPVNRAGSVGPESAPRCWRDATCSGVPPARPDAFRLRSGRRSSSGTRRRVQSQRAIL